ncbi:MerR family transcriptional regulator [Clostridium tagluense]|uniref:MerR family transcriptional regulator n=1 Tax=Clostridium tagluense TaxID=360422 RepID=UPI001CF2FA77|nr:MerR family transcriptional regulator [Clostridium tagluense]MCB2299034.1 MerR family transcriptional regulator [Clostridium tagluense]
MHCKDCLYNMNSNIVEKSTNIEVILVFRIGDFSKLAKTTTKTLRFYDEVGLLKPSFVDDNNGYRYYEPKQFFDLNRIIALRQIGLPIDEIKKVIISNNKIEIAEIYQANKINIENEIKLFQDKLSRINYLLDDVNNTKQTDYQVTLKNMPQHKVYYEQGIVSGFQGISKFILDTINKLKQSELNIKFLSPPYSYIAYLDSEYKESDIRIEYAQAVEPPTALADDKQQQFKTYDSTLFACAFHKGSYERLPKAYGYIMDWIEKNGYSMIENPRECHIKGSFDTSYADEWITEIQIPIVKK